MKTSGLYLHIPFCASKCPYCDFYSLPSRTGTEAFTQALTDEIKTLKRSSLYLPENFRESTLFDSVYLGGGTPTALSEDELKSILCAVRENFTITDDAEITVECNPSSKNLPEKLSALAQNGVNRVSFGMQSAIDNERRKLGRLSDSAGVKAAVENAKKAGINNISVDVMLGIPEQTENSLKETVEFALSLGISHISAYMLKLEEGTYFFNNREKINLPDEDRTADFYLQLCELLKNAGMRHYEISNFCFGDKIGRHNIKYWKCEEYLGIGPSAHSFIDGKRVYYNRDINAFINGENPVFDCTGGDEEEKLMLALRTDYGYNLPPVKSNSLKSLTGNLVRNGLAQIKGDNLSLTDKGMLISNTIITNLLSEI